MELKDICIIENAVCHLIFWSTSNFKLKKIPEICLILYIFHRKMQKNLKKDWLITLCRCHGYSLRQRDHKWPQTSTSTQGHNTVKTVLQRSGFCLSELSASWIHKHIYFKVSRCVDILEPNKYTMYTYNYHSCFHVRTLKHKKIKKRQI